MAFGIEFFIGRGGKRREANPARGGATGVFKIRNLSGYLGLAGPRRSSVQKKDMVENPD